MKLLTAALVILLFLMMIGVVVLLIDAMIDWAISDYLGIIVRKKLGIKKEDRWK